MKISKNFVIFLLLIFALSTTACTVVYEGGVNDILNHSIGILGIVATLMGVLVALITLIFIIAIAFGFFEFKRWKDIREGIEAKARDTEAKIKVIEADASHSKDLMQNIEAYHEKLREEVEKTPLPPLSEKPSEELKQKLDEYGHRLEILEALGVSLKPEDYVKRGTDLYYKGKYELALKAYDKAIELKPDYITAWSNKGAVLSNLKQYDEALKACNKATELKPDDAESWNNKGLALSNLKQYDEALKALNKAIELKPDDASAWFNRACLYSLNGDKEKALKNLSRAIELDIKDKEEAKKDEDFKNLWQDEDFKKITQ